MTFPIPWKKTSHDNNHHVATSRINSLELSLERTSLRKKYDEAIQIMLDKNYTRIIPKSRYGPQPEWSNFVSTPPPSS